MPSSGHPPAKQFTISKDSNNDGSFTVVRRLTDGKILVRISQFDMPEGEVTALLELQRRLTVALEDERRQTVLGQEALSDENLSKA